MKRVAHDARSSAIPGRILIADDERLIRWSLKERFEQDGHEVIVAANGAEALAAFKPGHVDLVLLDYRLPDYDGLSLLAELHERDSDVPIVVITAHSSVEHAVNAMKAGAYYYVPKPFDLDAVAIVASRALETTHLRRRIGILAAKEPALASIVGDSPAVRKLKALIPRIASSPASTVLITGESGTGKDLAARAVHNLSPRREHPFVNITCSALPASLLESELFGHERGAFTDAKTRKEGLLERASGGSVFLDEIGELEMPMQAKLLRFLEDRGFRRVGGTTELQADVRVIAATNVDLRQAIKRGAFREDLYYRLAVVTIHLPPLRERDGDLDLLVAFLVERFNDQFGRHIHAVSPEALQLLRSHPWPGNIRELRNAVERAVLLSTGDTLRASDFSFLNETSADPEQFRLPAGGLDMRELERSLVLQALERTSGNQTRAAELLGMNRDQIRYRLQRYGLLSGKYSAGH